ncbi:alginate lyase family protein [Flavisolibacter ginsenosidimutans]|uniref:Alginate lyase family protein n=1 Tax=Flavisolibacter ginsenosidimutans TaxID=661481 RepID=A0A5B8UH16_9BACT|nr:alginate lyase family protein [Flavisolibacter ginsenosidimutans]QEC55803.1 alginate lyase family protein [Flavisolibacter ginsenosidimutans]
MKNFLLVASLLFAACTATKGNSVPPQSPAVFILNADVLSQKKAAINVKDAALMPAYKKLLKDADKALNEGPFSVMEKKNNPPSGDRHDYMSLAPYFWPDPIKNDGLPYIRKDGQTNPEVKDYKDKEYMPKMCELVHTLGLAYYFSGDEKYAAHAAKLLEVWFLNADTKMNPNLNFAQAIKGVNNGRGAGLIDARHFMNVVDAIGLLQGSKAWTKADQTGMQKWFADFLNWMQTSSTGKDEMNAKNNHGTYYDALRLSLALFINDKEAAKSIVQNVTKRLDAQMDEEGKFPKEMERTIALHYNVFDLHAFFMVASMAGKNGFDLWHYTSPSGASLKKGFDYFHPYISKQKEWTGQQIKPFDFEEGYPLLLTAAERYGCNKCRDEIKTLAGLDAEKMRENLLY